MLAGGQVCSAVSDTVEPRHSLLSGNLLQCDKAAFRVRIEVCFGAAARGLLAHFLVKGGMLAGQAGMLACVLTEAACLRCRSARH
jgi:hypothetical protein